MEGFHFKNFFEGFACVIQVAYLVYEAIGTKFTIHLQNSKFKASDDFKSDDSKTFLRQDIAKRFPDS